MSIRTATASRSNPYWQLRRYQWRVTIAMLSNLVRDHQRNKHALRQENEQLRRAAVESVALSTARMVDSVNTGMREGSILELDVDCGTGVAHVFANQKTLENEAKRLQQETNRFAKQTAQWLQMTEQFNTVTRRTHLRSLDNST